MIGTIDGRFVLMLEVLNLEPQLSHFKRIFLFDPRLLTEPFVDFNGNCFC